MDYRRDHGSPQEDIPECLTDCLDDNLTRLKTLLRDSADLVIREFALEGEKDRKAAIVYLENMVTETRIQDNILDPLTRNAVEIAARNLKPHQLAAYIQSQLATASQAKPVMTLGGIAENLFAGNTVLLFDKLAEAFVFDTPKLNGRMVGTPETEVTIRGPRESFVETLGTNIALLRRRINHPDLQIEAVQVGLKTKTQVRIVYLNGVVNEKVVDEIKRRLSRIEIDGVLGAGYVEQLMGDAPYSPFSTIGYSERPDVVASKILEGRAAIVIDGNPEVLTAPALFIESFQSPDDYNFNPFYATLIRWIHYIAFAISVLGPAVYIALSSFNQELIPTPLFITMATGAEGTPYPTFVEVIIIGLLFEIFREGGVRLPRSYGQGITFVVALVLAQASVSMGLVGIATVAVVAITAAASLLVPSQASTSILIRLALAILASIFGTYGILLGLLWVLAHLVALRSFGVPYMAPFAPFNPRDFTQDTILRAPLWAMFGRPRTIGWHNPKRQASGQKPSPQRDDDQR